jgi:hypothetical protein
MDFLQRSQRDLAAILEDEADFADVPVFIARPRDEGDAMQIMQALNDALMGITTKNDKAGLAVMVMMPDVEMPNANSLSLRMECVFSIRVREMPMINEGENGAGISAEQCALNILKALHQRSAGGSPFYPDKKAVREVSGDAAGLTYDVVFRRDATEAKRTFVTLPTLSLEGDTLTMACTTSGAAIRYTTDGSFPNKAATLYSAPVDVGSLPSGTLIRAAAYKDGLSGSDVGQLEL